MEFRVEVAWPRPAGMTDEQLEQLGAGIPRVVTTIDNGLLVYVRFDVAADSTSTALAAAVALSAAAYQAVFGVLAEPSQVSLWPLEQRSVIPGPLDIVGTSDVAGMLDVSRQRAAQLAPRLPAVLGYASGAPVWVRRAVELATESWDRSPGRRPRPEDLAG